MERYPYSFNKELTEDTVFSPEQFRSLAARIHRNANQMAAFSNFVWGMNVIGIGTGLFWWWWKSSTDLLFPALILYIASKIVLSLLASRLRKKMGDIEKVIRFLENTQDVKSLGTILDLTHAVFYCGSNILCKVNNVADSAARRLLPLIQPTDTEVLNSEHRKALRRQMFFCGAVPSATFTQLRLRALENIGDKRDLPDVLRLIEDNGWYFERKEEISAAAQRCAEIIEERIGREQDREILLRPGIQPDVAPVLLRPACEATTDQPKHLLRAVINDNLFSDDERENNVSDD